MISFYIYLFVIMLIEMDCYFIYLFIIYCYYFDNRNVVCYLVFHRYDYIYLFVLHGKKKII